MTIQTITPAALALVIDGLGSEQVDLDMARSICRRAFIAQGLGTPDGMELELYPGRNCILLFARLLSRNPVFYRFFDTDALIEAERSVRDLPPSTLFSYEGSYIVAITPYADLDTPPDLSEYAERLNAPPAFMAVLRERGETMPGAF